MRILIHNLLYKHVNVDHPRGSGFQICAPRFPFMKEIISYAPYPNSEYHLVSLDTATKVADMSPEAAMAYIRARTSA